MTTFNFKDISPIPRKVSQAGGLAAKRVVVATATPRVCAYPGAANAGNIEGVTLYGADDAGHVGVQQEGEAICIAAGAIAANAQVNIADTVGRVKAVSEAGGTVINPVGRALTAATQAGDEITVALDFGRYTA